MLAKVTGLLQAMHRRRMAPPHLDQLRLAGLRAVVRHSMERVPFYRALFREAGIRI
jgi:phenylacetate-coenzyme A ligase PaaK-like adenylate-forming protein